MKKINVDDILGRLGYIVSEKENGIVYYMSDGKVAKIFDTEFLSELRSVGYDFEEKILNSKKIINVPEILTPIDALYARGEFVGYTMPMAKGISYDKFNSCKSYSDACNLYKHACEFSKLESIIKRSSDVVFPDMISFDNIFYDGKDFEFIDYDGLQVGKYLSPALSSSLGDRYDYQDSKYKDGLYFNKNLDIKSLIYLYFINVFNIDFVQLDYEYSFDRECLIDKILSDLSIDSDDLKEKIYKLFLRDIPNEYLGNTMFDIADSYDMSISSSGKRYLKRK